MRAASSSQEGRVSKVTLRVRPLGGRVSLMVVSAVARLVRARGVRVRRGGGAGIVARRAWGDYVRAQGLAGARDHEKQPKSKNVLSSGIGSPPRRELAYYGASKLFVHHANGTRYVQNDEQHKSNPLSLARHNAKPLPLRNPQCPSVPVCTYIHRVTVNSLTPSTWKCRAQSLRRARPSRLSVNAEDERKAGTRHATARHG